MKRNKFQKERISQWRNEEVKAKEKRARRERVIVYREALCELGLPPRGGQRASLELNLKISNDELIERLRERGELMQGLPVTSCHNRERTPFISKVESQIMLKKSDIRRLEQ